MSASKRKGTSWETAIVEYLRVNGVPAAERWADLVQWALDGGWWPWRPIGPSCRADFDRCGSCYCGKLRTPEQVRADGSAP